MLERSADDEESSAASGVEATVHRGVDSIDANQLNNLVVQSDGGTLFHRYEWLAAVEDAFDREPRHVLTTKSGNPVGFLPNFVVDLPLPGKHGGRLHDAVPLTAVEPPPPGYGGPVVAGKRRENLPLLFEATDLTDRLHTVFHRVQTFDTDAVRYGRYLESLGYEPRMKRCTLVIELDDWETVRGDMDSGRRRSLRSAVDQDFEVERFPLGDDLDRTYAQYVANMERVGGTTYPRALFVALADRLPDRVRVFKTSVDGREVGRYVHLLDDENDVLHHWLSAIGDSDDFQYYPSELLHRSAIRWGIERGYDRYSFGPTRPHFSDSVFKFKRKYGATPVPLLCWERGTFPVAWRLYDAGRSWYRRSQVDVG